MTDERKQYEVGYGKPPQQTRFAKGRSGNPSGRRKGAKNISTLLTEACQEKVTVSRKGRKVRMTKVGASLHQLANKAAGGDLRAIRELLFWCKTLNDAVQDLPAVSSFDENDKQVVASILKRLRQRDANEVNSSASDNTATSDQEARKGE